MKTLSNLNILSLLAFALLVTFGACSSVNNDVEAISNEDVDLATHIVTTSIADDESGMMSSLYDAFSDVSSEGISYSTTSAQLKSDPQHRNDGRGRERNYTYSYDSETGIHSLEYERSVQNSAFSKSLEVNQEIIFTNLDSTFIEFPRQDRKNIETISYYGTKVGEFAGKYRSGSFSKEDDFLLTGVHSTSSILTLSGTHSGTGNAEGITRDSVEASRSYSIDLEFSNVAINKDTVKAQGSLEFAVSGSIAYSLTMNKTIDGVPDEIILEGTIELLADGTAILKFNKLVQTIKFALGTGELQTGGNQRGN